MKGAIEAERAGPYSSTVRDALEHLMVEAMLEQLSGVRCSRMDQRLI